LTQPYSLKLSGELGLRGIEALKAQIAEALSSHDAVAIDTSAVEGVDASAIQLLLSAQKTANADGKAMSLSASAAMPLGRTLVALGLVAADGAPLVPETSTWTIKAAA